MAFSDQAEFPAGDAEWINDGEAPTRVVRGMLSSSQRSSSVLYWSPVFAVNNGVDERISSEFVSPSHMAPAIAFKLALGGISVGLGTSPAPGAMSYRMTAVP